MAYDELNTVFARNLKLIMHLKGMKKCDLMEKTGVSAPAITHYTHGRTLPTLSTAAIIADALGVTVGALCGDFGEINETNYYQIFKY